MKTIEVQGSLRQNLGKIDAKNLRKQGIIPCVLYHPDGNIHFTLLELEALKVIRSQDTYLVKLTIGDKLYNAVVRESQFHPVHDYLLHMDFLNVAEDRKVTVQIPLKTTGTSVGVLAGGVLVQKMRLVKVKGIFTSIPDAVYVDVSKLDLGKSLRVKDIETDNFIILNNKDIPVASIDIPRSLKKA